MKLSKFKLKDYSVFATCFLLTQTEAVAEAVYSDISPDTLIDQDLEAFGIDINDDGLIDFAFLKRSFSFLATTYSSNYVTSHVNALIVGPELFGNLIAGTSNTFSPSYGATTFYYPYAIPIAEMIDGSMDFQNAGYQFMAFRYRGLYSSYAHDGGRWLSGYIDRYIGVYFKDTADCYHYGWIRCDVKNDAKELVIKDYAFETKCNTVISAGDTIGDTTTVGINDINTLNATVYSFENNIYISVNELSEKLEIDIYNLAGKLIYSNVMKDRFFSIKLNQPNGNYIINLSSDSKKYSKKIFIV